jgi:probable rRNA maturation factor
MVEITAPSVEVYVQDYFSEENSVPQPDGNLHSQTAAITTAPIPLEAWEDWFQTWVTELNPDFSPTHEYELSLRLTHDADIQALNAQYRHKDQPTDVLAFAALEVDYPELEELQLESPLYLGDIVISVETAQRQAQEQNHSLKQELAWLAAHGLLHLLGWDHPDDERLAEMLHQQDKLLQAIGLNFNTEAAQDPFP